VLGLSAMCTEAFTIRPSLVGRTLRLQVSGSADGEIQPMLPGYLRQVQSEAERLGVGEVVVDLHELYFMNSSCFKAFVTWMDALGKAGARPSYSLRFLKDRNLNWQTRSLDALRRMAMEAVIVEDYPGSHS
jgi:hypothetical protein